MFCWGYGCGLGLELGCGLALELGLGLVVGQASSFLQNCGLLHLLRLHFIASALCKSHTILGMFVEWGGKGHSSGEWPRCQNDPLPCRKEDLSTVN